MSYLTRPAHKKRLNTIVYDPSIDEEKTHHNLDLKKVEKKPVDIQKRIADASAKYDDYVPEGAKVPDAMKPDPKRLMSDKTEQYLRKHLIEKMKKEPLDSSEVRFLMDTKPKQPEASPEQIATLKKKLDKYRYIHGEEKPMKKQKPFVKKKSAVLSIPPAKIDTTPIALNNAPIRSAEDLERERKFNQLVKEIEDEKKRIRNSGLGALI